ncbi:sensor histidine kinase [Blastococcus saxobsidens]|uniref:histidine kinase n=1 Tax=Blastococcus saxobsidens (strain DD2) TaxID=1146883 RepID=H6RT17_BLASD|nr:sensor domain-containing protein [Blastococcus saxobsidens]CCG04320.1 Putative two-component system sensor kinase (modular protein) [Blastococcus saxobsidens DD2]
MPPTTSLRGRGALAARIRALLADARPGWPGRALYALASLPLAAVYAGVYAALIGSVVALVYGVGVLLVLVVLAATRGFAGLERRLARTLLGVDIPDGERVLDQPGLVRRGKRLVFAADTWRALGWLGARVLMGAATFATLTFGTAAFVGFGWSTEWSHEWNPLTALPLLALMAVVVVLTLAVLDLLVRLAASVAPRLLGTAPEQRIAALQQSTRRLADRNKLARDLHDTIGHALTASLLQATAARRTLTPADDRPVQPDFARQALGHIETNTRAALAELDRVLTVLRAYESGAADGGHDPAPFAAPSLADLEDLLAGLRDGGLPVALVVDGEVDDVPAGVQELAYRVIQEGTTNVLRHAGTPLTVAQVVRSGDTLVVRVCNERASQLDSRPGPGGGRGLAGLRERAAAAGGTLTAEPSASGGFDLCVTLPLSGAA